MGNPLMVARERNDDMTTLPRRSGEICENKVMTAPSQRQCITAGPAPLR